MIGPYNDHTTAMMEHDAIGGAVDFLMVYVALEGVADIRHKFAPFQENTSFTLMIISQKRHKPGLPYLPEGMSGPYAFE